MEINGRPLAGGDHFSMWDVFPITKSSRKRHMCADITVTPMKTMKRRRTQEDHATSEELSPVSSIIKAVERLSTDADLVPDGSRSNILPTVRGKHSDLNAISPKTMANILEGKYDDTIDNVTIIDCRYPYEYDGGHIKGAINLFSKDDIHSFLKDTMTSSEKVHVLVFHCEFSSERGPKMYQFLRSFDRDVNKDFYPRLNFPEIYLLEGGYKAFYHECAMELCEPQSYKPMLDKEHTDDLRHFRKKSKSWTAGENKRRSRKQGGGTKLCF